MKILISSYWFYPSIGGIETMSRVLATEFTKRGHMVKVVTHTPAKQGGCRNFPFKVIRCPGPLKLIELVRWCDVYLHSTISLRTAWPLALVHRPWVITNQSWLSRLDGSLSLLHSLKRFSLRFATNISISQAIADNFSVQSIVIPNAYQNNLFHKISGIKRNKELVFLGRLVSEKGVSLLLEALEKLRKRGQTPKLTVIGLGPEETRLLQLAERAGVKKQVNFVGAKSGEELARLLNAHQIMVVPSSYNEPFGIVALEGIACGCVVVGSEGGGLKDAIGPCGVTFPNGNADALTKTLADLLKNKSRLKKYKAKAKAHLLQYKPDKVAVAYLKVIEAAVKDEEK